MYIVGAVVRGRLSCSSADNANESLDGDLAYRVFQLIQVRVGAFPNPGTLFTAPSVTIYCLLHTSQVHCLLIHVTNMARNTDTLFYQTGRRGAGFKPHAKHRKNDPRALPVLAVHRGTFLCMVFNNIGFRLFAPTLAFRVPSGFEPTTCSLPHTAPSVLVFNHLSL